MLIWYIVLILVPNVDFLVVGQLDFFSDHVNPMSERFDPRFSTNMARIGNFGGRRIISGSNSNQAWNRFSPQPTTKFINVRDEDDDEQDEDGWSSVLAKSSQQTPRLDNRNIFHRNIGSFRPRGRCDKRIRVINGATRVRDRGTLVRFQCSYGYHMVGAAVAVCVRGKWSDPPPLCVRNGCGKLPIPIHGTIRQLYGGGVALFSCNYGYSLIGSQLLTCDGHFWNGTAPVCIEIPPVTMPIPRRTTTDLPLLSSTTTEAKTTSTTNSPWETTKISEITTKSDVNFDITTARSNASNSVTTESVRTSTTRFRMTSTTRKIPSTVSTTTTSMSTRPYVPVSTEKATTTTNSSLRNPETVRTVSPTTSTTEAWYSITPPVNRTTEPSNPSKSSSAFTETVESNATTPSESPYFNTTKQSLESATDFATASENLEVVQTTTVKDQSSPGRETVEETYSTDSYFTSTVTTSESEMSTTEKNQNSFLDSAISTSLLIPLRNNTTRNELNFSTSTDTLADEIEDKELSTTEFHDLFTDNQKSNESTKSLLKLETEKSSFNLNLNWIIGSIFGVVLLILIGIVSMYCWRRNKGIARARSSDIDGKTLSFHEGSDELVWSDPTDNTRL